MELQLQLEVRFAAARWRVGASTRRIQTRGILARRVASETNQRVTTFRLRSVVVDGFRN
jgi:hypothetical protein